MVIVAGRKGGHKGRMRTYTSPEEIDAQMKAEKERKKVGVITPVKYSPSSKTINASLT